MNKRTFGALASSAVLAFGVGACGDEEESASGGLLVEVRLPADAKLARPDRSEASVRRS